MESGKDLPNDNGGGGRSSSEREFECKGCGAKNVVKKSEGTPKTSSSSASRKRRWMEAAAKASEAAGGGGSSRRANRLFNNATSRARKLNGEQGRTDGRAADSFQIARRAVASLLIVILHCIVFHGLILKRRSKADQIGFSLKIQSHTTCLWKMPKMRI